MQRYVILGKHFIFVVSSSFGNLLSDAEIHLRESGSCSLGAGHFLPLKHLELARRKCISYFCTRKFFSILDRVGGGWPPATNSIGGEKTGTIPIFVFLRLSKEVLGDERECILVSSAIPQQSFCRPLPFPILWSLGKV